MKFKELPDGETFQIEEDVKAGMDIKYVKALEDGGPHNSVRTDNSNQTIYIADNVRVVPV